MNKRTYLPLAFLILIAAGCTSIAKKEEVISVQEEVAQINTALGKQLVYLKEYTDEKLADQAKEAAGDRVTLSEKIEGISAEGRALSGKIDELDYRTRESFEKNKTEQEAKSFEYRRDIENIKKSQTDVMTTIAAVNQSVTLMQNDLLALKNHQVQVTAALEKINLKLEQQPSGDVAALKEELDKKVQILLNEITRQESEIFLLKHGTAKLSPAAAVETEKKKEPATERKAVTEPVKEQEKEKTKGKSEPTVYVVKYGDYLTRIAKRYNTTKKAIMKLNNVTDENIQPGQKLKIPAPE